MRTEPNGLIDAILTINPNGTYSYVNQTGSCWVDWNDQGRWHEEDDGLLVLESENLCGWPMAAVLPSKDNATGGVHLSVVDAQGHALGKAWIRLGDGSVAKVSDDCGRVDFDQEEIKRVVGRPEWITFVTEQGAGFARVPTGAWIVQLSPRVPQQRRVTYLARVGYELKELGGGGAVLSRCP